MPIFNKQFYSDTVPENIELHTPLSVAIQAESPLGRKLIYTIVEGNELEEFAVDFNTGNVLITISSPLYQTYKEYLFKHSFTYILFRFCWGWVFMNKSPGSCHVVLCWP